MMKQPFSPFDVTRKIRYCSIFTYKYQNVRNSRLRLSTIWNLMIRLLFVADEEDIDVEEEDDMYSLRMSQPDPAIDTSRVEEIPAKEPKFHAVPLKSVLKKRGSGSGPGTPQNTPTQENRPLTLRQELHASFKLVPSPRANNIRNPLYSCSSISIDAKVYGNRSQFDLSKWFPPHVDTKCSFMRRGKDPSFEIDNHASCKIRD